MLYMQSVYTEAASLIQKFGFEEKQLCLYGQQIKQKNMPLDAVKQYVLAKISRLTAH